MSQRWSAIFCATGAWGGKPIGHVRRNSQKYRLDSNDFCTICKLENRKKYHQSLIKIEFKNLQKKSEFLFTNRKNSSKFRVCIKIDAACSSRLNRASWDDLRTNFYFGIYGRFVVVDKVSTSNYPVGIFMCRNWRRFALFLLSCLTAGTV